MAIVSGLRLVVAGLLFLVLYPGQAGAWGDLGHRIVGAVAQQELMRNYPAAWRKIEALLATDTDSLTPPDFPSRAMWADKYAQSDRDGDRKRYDATWRWHFANVNVDAPDFTTPCDPALPAGEPASRGPADACVLDKIDQFTRELSSPATPPAERLLALKFLIHFVGDVHQPLHVAEHDEDKGGNLVPVLPTGKRTSESLHLYWDVDLVDRLGSDAETIARALLERFKGKEAEWAGGTLKDWARGSNALARSTAYAIPKATVTDDAGKQAVPLDEHYAEKGGTVAAKQLTKAGVRLARLLGQALD
jgi:hypothetical protein